jgi:hypothetical protein
MRASPIDHHTANADPEEAPEPETQYGSFQCDVERSFNQEGDPVAGYEDKKAGPFDITPPPGYEYVCQEHS